MNVESMIGSTLRATDRLHPGLGARAAASAFLHVGPRMPLHPGAAEIMGQARRDTVVVPGAPGDVVRYEWGSGDRVVLLVHGWQGRAAQFAPLAARLAHSGMRVVAFDAPAHGAAGGRSCTVLDIIRAAQVLADDALADGSATRLRAVVGHSLGGLAAMTAVADGLPAETTVTVAAPADVDAVFRVFAAQLDLPDDVRAGVRARVASRVGERETDALSAVRPVPGLAPLVVHDRADRRMPVAEAVRIAEAHPGAELLVTEGSGHARILATGSVIERIADHVHSAPARALAA